MRKFQDLLRLELFVFCSVIPLIGSAQSPTLTSYSDSQEIVYDTNLITSNAITEVLIGDQIWMKYNLDVDTFQNGDKIIQAQSLKEWIEASKNKQPAWCYSDNDTINGSIYGKLYNFYAVEDPRGLAPRGWRIPSYSDWDVLTETAGGKRVAGLALKNTDGWKYDGNGVNSSGFSALPGGWRSTAIINTNQGFSRPGIFGCWWSSDYDKRTESIWTISLTARRRTYFMLYDNNKSDGYSVRCIKN